MLSGLLVFGFNYQTSQIKGLTAKAELKIKRANDETSSANAKIKELEDQLNQQSSLPISKDKNRK